MGYDYPFIPSPNGGFAKRMNDYKPKNIFDEITYLYHNLR